jgi:SAM-dependent methyltransferase
VEKADLFIAVMEHNWGRGEREARGIARVLEAHGVPRGSDVLELGCGIGRVAIPLARLGYRVTCLDFSEPFIARARGKARQEGVEGVAFVVGDAYRVDEALAGHSFDAAYMTWTTLLGYGSREDDLELLRRTREVVKPGGLLVVANTASRDVVQRFASCRSPEGGWLGYFRVVCGRPRVHHGLPGAPHRPSGSGSRNPGVTSLFHYLVKPISIPHSPERT